MLRKIGRLFVIKTRLEAYLVTYAIAVGAIERGLHYMDQYQGYAGVVLALACLGVPFIAGAKLVDSVKPQPVAVPAQPRVMSGRRRDAKRFGRRHVPFGQQNRRPIARPATRRG